jgi:hypothetical protein
MNIQYSSGRVAIGNLKVRQIPCKPAHGQAYYNVILVVINEVVNYRDVLFSYFLMYRLKYLPVMFSLRTTDQADCSGLSIPALEFIGSSSVETIIIHCTLESSGRPNLEGQGYPSNRCFEK